MRLLINRRLVAVLVTVIALPAYADSWLDTVEHGLTVELEVAHNTNQDKGQKRQLLFTPDFSANIFSDTVLNVEGRWTYDNLREIQSDQNQFQLRTFTLETFYNDSYLTLGKQQIVWGKADGLKVLDVVNPQHWHEFILDDFDDSRIPLWAVNFETSLGDNNLQFISVLEQEYHDFADSNTAYAFTSPKLVPTPPSGIPVTIQATQRPKRVLKDADVGLRLSGFAKGWDYSFIYFYHFDDTPTLFRTLEQTTQGPHIHIRPQHKRTHLVGTALSNAFGNLTIRSELGYSLDKYYSTNNNNDHDGVTKHNELAYVLGLDWSGFSDTFISLQLYQSYLTNYKAGVLRDRTNTTITSLIEQNYLNDTITSRLLWLHSTNHDNGLIRPKLSYQFNDTTNLWLGADIFYGNRKGLYGQFDQQDRAFVGTEIAI